VAPDPKEAVAEVNDLLGSPRLKEDDRKPAEIMPVVRIRGGAVAIEVPPPTRVKQVMVHDVVLVAPGANIKKRKNPSQGTLKQVC
jgi:hypothetical protein